MKKKIFGIKISTIIIAFVCLIAAFALWLFVEVSQVGEAEPATDDQGACEETSYNTSNSPEAIYEL